jgi:hypothetical protein
MTKRVTVKLVTAAAVLMRPRTSGWLSKTFSWRATVVMTIAAVALVLTTVRGSG